MRTGVPEVVPVVADCEMRYWVFRFETVSDYETFLFNMHCGALKAKTSSLWHIG